MSLRSLCILRSLQNMSSFALGDGKLIPKVGFGTYLASDDETKEGVLAALAAGYRHIDTAGAPPHQLTFLRNAALLQYRNAAAATTAVPPTTLSSDTHS